jgi:hypothetical protein
MQAYCWCQEDIRPARSCLRTEMLCESLNKDDIPCRSQRCATWKQRSLGFAISW